jgi:RNA polymerase sigma-70 factor, ECF subfamily
MPTVEPMLRDELLAAIPSLRAFALSLTGTPDGADDLVQDTLLRAWTHMDRFVRGTDLNAWLFTILRNRFYSDLRRRGREVQDADGSYAHRLATVPDQGARLDLEDFRKALMKLPVHMRESLLLVTAEGFSYAEAAEICGCPEGTIKSRVNRARCRLSKSLAVDSEADFGPGRVIIAALHLAA